MKILFVLIPLSLILLGISIWGFFWMVNNKQFDDLDSAGWRMLNDDMDEPLEGCMKNNSGAEKKND